MNCPNCGHELPENKSRRKTTPVIIGIIALLVVLCGAAFFIFGWPFGESPENDYIAAEIGSEDEVTNDTVAAIDGNVVVAQFDGMDIRAMDVSLHTPWAELSLFQEYFDTFGDWELDYNRIFRDGLTFGRVVREESVRMAATMIIQANYARQMGIVLTDEDVAMLNSRMDDIVLQLGDDLHDALRAEGFQDEDHLRSFLEIQQVIEAMVWTIIEDPAKFAVFEQYMEEANEPDIELLGAKHILTSFREFDTEEEAEAHADALLERALAGEDFDMLIREYGQDGGMERFPNGYSFASGDMVPEFEQATRGLEMGEISGLVRSQFGIHIIKRIEPNINDWYLLHNMQPPSPEQRMLEAIFAGFNAMTERAEIVFLPALDDITIGQ